MLWFSLFFSECLIVTITTIYDQANFGQVFSAGECGQKGLEVILWKPGWKWSITSKDAWPHFVTHIVAADKCRLYNSTAFITSVAQLLVCVER